MKLTPCLKKAMCGRCCLLYKFDQKTTTRNLFVNGCFSCSSPKRGTSFWFNLTFLITYSFADSACSIVFISIRYLPNIFFCRFYLPLVHVFWKKNSSISYFLHMGFHFHACFIILSSFALCSPFKGDIGMTTVYFRETEIFIIHLLLSPRIEFSTSARLQRWCKRRLQR